MAEDRNHPDQNNTSRPEEVREDQFSKNANVPAPMVSQEFEPPASAAPEPPQSASADDE